MMLILRRRKMAMLRRRMLRRKTDPKIGKHTLCEPAQSKCVTQAILYGNLQAKCRTRIPRHPFCASLRSQNAHGHVTGGILREKNQGKCRTLPIPRRLSPFSVATLFGERVSWHSKDTRAFNSQQQL